MLILVSTACSPAAQATIPGESSQGVPGYRSQPYEGGMNGYSDIDPRRPATGAAVTKAQAKGLKDNAQRNVIDMTDDLKTNTDRTLDKKVDNLKQLGKNAKQDAKEFGNRVDGATDDLRDTSKALQDNARSTGREFSKDAKQAAENVKSNVKGAGSNVADTVKATAKNVTENVKDSVKDAAKDVSNAVKSTAKDTANSIKDGAADAMKPSGYYNTSGNKLN